MECHGLSWNVIYFLIPSESSCNITSLEFLNILARRFGKVHPVWPDAWNLIPNPSIRSFDAVATTKCVVVPFVTERMKEVP